MFMLQNDMCILMLDVIVLHLTDVNTHSTLDVQKHEFLKSF